MDGSSRYRESEEYCNRGRSSDKVVEFGEFLFPGTYCDRGNSGQTKTINEQIKCHSTPRNEIGSCKQFTSAAMENPSIADLEMLQSGNSFSELLSGNAYLGSVLQPNTRYLPQMITNYAFPVPCMSFARSSDLSVVDGKNEELMSNRECGALRAWENNEQATLQIGNRSTFPTESEVTDDELGCKDLQVALCKELTKSDVGNTGRIVLPKREAEACLPPLSERDGIVLHMEDMTLQCSWKFKYRFWPNNRSRMYILENTGDFVRAHCLQTGDSLIIYRNSTSGNFFVRGKKANPEQSPMDLAKWNWKNQFSTDEEHCSSSMYNK